MAQEGAISAERQQSAPAAHQVRLSGVRVIRALPDRTEILTDSATLDLRIGRERLNILAKGLSPHLRRKRRPVATFLYFPEDRGATVVIEERSGWCTLLINETQPASGNPA